MKRKKKQKRKFSRKNEKWLNKRDEKHLNVSHLFTEAFIYKNLEKRRKIYARTDRDRARLHDKDKGFGKWRSKKHRKVQKSIPYNSEYRKTLDARTRVERYREDVCRKRMDRRKSLFRNGSAGSGKKIRSKKTFNEDSKVRC